MILKKKYNEKTNEKNLLLHYHYKDDRVHRLAQIIRRITIML